MKCEEIQQFLYTSEKEEGNSENWTFILEHIDNCAQCGSVYNKILKADALIYKIKKTDHHFVYEEQLTRSIMAPIKKEKEDNTGNALDYLLELISPRPVKLVLGSLLLVCTLSFIYMEYSDTKRIVALEQKIGTRWNQKPAYAGVIQHEEGIHKFFYNAYKLFSGQSSYLEINKELVLMKREDLLALFEEYDKLDEPTKIRLNEMRNQFLGDASSVKKSGFGTNEIISLRKEVERQSQELKYSLNKRELK